MKAIMRGGPKNRKVMQAPDGTTRFEVIKPNTINHMDMLSMNPISTMVIRGYYSRTLDARKKDGAYYFVWMGWDDE